MLTGKGDGSFRPATNFDVGGLPTSVAVGDFNGDGFSDLAVTNSSHSYNYYSYGYSDNVSVLLGKGDGSFGQQMAVRNPDKIIRRETGN